MGDGAAKVRDHVGDLSGGQKNMADVTVASLCSASTERQQQQHQYVFTSRGSIHIQDSATAAVYSGGLASMHMPPRRPARPGAVPLKTTLRNSKQGEDSNPTTPR